MFLTKYNFVDTFRHLHPEQIKYSFWSARAMLRPSNKGWRLDYFLIDKNHLSMVVDSDIHNKVYGSDHCPISLKLDFVMEK